MKPGSLNVVRLVTLLAFIAALSRASADTKVNPYEAIAARNPFHLKDPPPPPDPNDVPKGPPPVVATVEVTGILNIFQKKQVFLEITPAPGKPVVRRTLTEGEREEAITVVSIDLENNVVTLDNAGVISTNTLKTSKPTAGAPPVAGLPGHPFPTAATGYVPPGGAVPAYTAPAANPSGRASPMVMGALPAGASVPGGTSINNYGANLGAYGTPGVAPNTAGGYNPGVNTYNPGVNTSVDALRGIPPRPVRTQTTQPEGPPVDPAVQYLNMLGQEHQARSKNIPFPPTPPIPGVDLGNQ